MKRIYILNAPPSAGKDIAAKFLTDTRSNVKQLEFKGHLYNILKVIYGITQEQFDSFKPESEKNLPRAELGGKSLREALIFVSETVIKPNYGKDYFGQKLTQEALQSDSEMFVTSDGGFPDEVRPLTDKFEVTVVRVHRDECCFIKSGDSRRYLKEVDIPNAFFVDVDNNSSLNEYFKKINDIVI